jgi:hypothetical protein
MGAGVKHRNEVEAIGTVEGSMGGIAMRDVVALPGSKAHHVRKERFGT